MVLVRRLPGDRIPMTDGRQTVLVVDDQPENLAILGGLLETHWCVRVADCGERALQLAAAEPRPDLIPLDVMMPGMDGYTVFERLRRDAATRDIPVIFITAQDSAEDEERGLERGAADYIVKPVRPLVVLARVRTQLENKRAKDWLRDQNLFLETEVMRRMHDNEIVQNASLASLAILAETRDTDTGNHIYRTQGYVEAIAKSLLGEADYAAELAGERLGRLVKAAPLHDIGKVGIPDYILQKPGALTPEEFAVMRTHARIGGDAIALAMKRVQEADESAYRSDSTPLAFLDVSRQIARWHHERWDGSGYPDRLQGQDIPLPARIMAVADAFDAMVSRRVYKDAVPIEKAFAIVDAERGRHFDPRVVAAFFQARDQVLAIARRFVDA